MSAQMFTGKVKKVCDTKTFASGASSRQFWCEEFSNNQYGKNKPKSPNVLAFEVFTSAKGPSDHYAGVADLDNIKPGMTVRFSWEAKGNVWTNKKTGLESCFVKLSVMTKIDVLGNGAQHGQAPAPADPQPDYADPLDDGGSMPF